MKITSLLIAFYALYSVNSFADSYEFHGMTPEVYKIRESVSDIFDSVRRHFEWNYRVLDVEETEQMGPTYWIKKSAYMRGSKGGWKRWSHDYADNFEPRLGRDIVYTKVEQGRLAVYKYGDDSEVQTLPLDQYLKSTLDPKKLYSGASNYELASDGRWIASTSAYTKGPIRIRYWGLTSKPVMFEITGRVRQNTECWVRYQDRFDRNLCKFQSERLKRLGAKYAKVKN